MSPPYRRSELCHRADDPDPTASGSSPARTRITFVRSASVRSIIVSTDGVRSHFVVYSVYSNKRRVNRAFVGFRIIDGQRVLLRRIRRITGSRRGLVSQARSSWYYMSRASYRTARRRASSTSRYLHNTRQHGLRQDLLTDNPYSRYDKSATHILFRSAIVPEGVPYVSLICSRVMPSSY